MALKAILKKIIPVQALGFYHLTLALVASMIYYFPANKMIVVGVTGTKGKTSTCNFIHAALSAGGEKVGMITTANFKLGDKEWLNDYHMTMLGRFKMQKMLRRFLAAGCQYAVVEVSSEGIKQWRHVGINFDILVFTNLSPEHIPSHGSFAKYRSAKQKIFCSLSFSKVKNINGRIIPKIIVTNADEEESRNFNCFPADKKLSYGINNSGDVMATEIISSSRGVDFKINNKSIHLNILGEFNVYNALAAAAVGLAEKIDLSLMVKSLEEIKILPGRMEEINYGQNFKVYVDYAHEKRSVEALLLAARKFKTNEQSKIIILLGADGGGRDKSKRQAMGELGAKLADYLIVSNVDPYDESPEQIVNDIVVVAEQFGKKKNIDLFGIPDRREGIKKCLELAGENDLVLITGKGSEQSITIDNVRYPWDDRQVVQKEIKKMS